MKSWVIFGWWGDTHKPSVSERGRAMWDLWDIFELNWHSKSIQGHALTLTAKKRTRRSLELFFTVVGRLLVRCVVVVRPERSEVNDEIIIDMYTFVLIGQFQYKASSADVRSEKKRTVENFTNSIRFKFMSSTAKDFIRVSRLTFFFQNVSQIFQGQEETKNL